MLDNVLIFLISMYLLFELIFDDSFIENSAN
jgi:hypothetical protein